MGDEETGDTTPAAATARNGPASGLDDGEPGSVLVVRAWRTGSGAGSFRARVIRVGDLPHGTARSTLTSDPDELCALVRAWVAEVNQ